MVPNTITSYHTFSPGTKARSTQVNTNFSNHRGDVLPISTDTAAALDLTYMLGTSEYYFSDLWVRDINLRGMTTTGNLEITRDNTVTLGAFKFSVGGTERFRVLSDTTRIDHLTVQGLTTTANMTVEKETSAGGTVGAWIVKGGASSNEIGYLSGVGTALWKHQCNRGSIIGTSSIHTTTASTIFSGLGVTTRGGPVFVELAEKETAGLTSRIQVVIATATSDKLFYIECLRDGVTIASKEFRVNNPFVGVTTCTLNLQISSVRFIDTSAGALGSTTAPTYQVRGYQDTNDGTTIVLRAFQPVVYSHY